MQINSEMAVDLKYITLEEVVLFKTETKNLTHLSSSASRRAG
jgi:hypothetical protein